MTVTVWREAGLGRIRLNRPEALNSLTLDMVRAMNAALDAFEPDPTIGAILLDGAGERGLCAGGDLRAMHAAVLAQDGTDAKFLSEEYRLNARIAVCPKPYVAFMDGITMGGGVGVSAHGAYRIVTERTKLAMPETAIGFLPDVGGTWLLSRGPGEIGTYLGLTGITIGAADAIYAGLADYFVPTAKLADVAAALAALTPPADAGPVLRAFATPAEPPLSAQRALLDRTMAFDDVAAIVNALLGDGSAFAAATAATLAEKSPTSLVATLALLRLGRRSASLQVCLDREYRTAGHILRRPDFLEGVRAAVIDKDRRPRWSPEGIDGVDRAEVNAWIGS